jgi:hypothetical protein
LPEAGLARRLAVILVVLLVVAALVYSSIRFAF